LSGRQGAAAAGGERNGSLGLEPLQDLKAILAQFDLRVGWEAL